MNSQWPNDAMTCWPGVIENWSRLSDRQLWENWRLPYTSDLLAAATALWIGNRLVKSWPHRGQRKLFYIVKENWIENHQAYLINGYAWRIDRSHCNACEGTGRDKLSLVTDICYKCDGSGIYVERMLYCHSFNVCGTPFSFHSYLPPRLVNGQGGEEEFHTFTPYMRIAQSTLPLPFQGILRMLQWRCKWGWQQASAEPPATTEESLG